MVIWITVWIQEFLKDSFSISLISTFKVLGLDLYSLSAFVVTKNVSNYSAEKLDV